MTATKTSDPPGSSTVPLSCIVPGHRRLEALLQTLGRIAACDPAPAEIIVHVDGGEEATRRQVADRFPAIKVLLSHENLGPGGSRNVLLRAASHPWVANFDDDAWPMDPDFFARVREVIEAHPDAAIISASSLPENWTGSEPWPVAVYSGYACVFNRDWFGKTSGFVPLPFAYCMEEVDLGLRLHALGGRMLHDPRLHVMHDMVLRPPEKNFHARALANIALFAFLRYPVWLLGIGLLQVFRRCLWLIRVCPSAIPAGLALLPGHLWRHRNRRETVPAAALFSWLRLQRTQGPARS